MAIFDDLVNEPKKAKVFRRKVVALHEKQDELRSAVAECVQRGVTDLCGSSAVYVRSRERVRVTAAPSPPAAVAAATRTPTKRSRPLGMGVRAKDAFQATMNEASVHINGLLGKASTAADFSPMVSLIRQFVTTCSGGRRFPTCSRRRPSE
jgi:hypothetical protein